MTMLLVRGHDRQLVRAATIREARTPRKTYWVYVLASRPGGAIYVGVTNDLSRRVWEHREKRGGAHTRRYGIDKLVYYESYGDVHDAIQRETSIKRWPRAWKTNLIASMNPTWRDLYEELNW